MADEQLTLTYEGPAVDDGRMDVRELSPALIGMADAVAAAQRQLFPDDEPANVHVAATGRGSFEVFLDVEAVASIVGAAQQALTGSTATAAENVKTVVSTLRRALDLIRRLGGQAPASVDDRGDGDVVITVEGDNQAPITVSRPVYNVLIDRGVRDGARAAMSPLNNPEIERARVEHEGESTTIERHERSAFRLSDDDAEVNEGTYEMTLTVLSVAFDGASWRFHDGQSSWTARVTDDAYYGTVIAGQDAFRAGDLLRARVHIAQRIFPDGTASTRREVVDVISHERVAGDDQQFPGLEE